jgi:hypothetical protein
VGHKIVEKKSDEIYVDHRWLNEASMKVQSRDE